MYTVPLGTLKIAVVSVNVDASCWEERFFWVAIQADYKAEPEGFSCHGFAE